MKGRWARQTLYLHTITSELFIIYICICTPYCLYIYSAACLIDLGDTFVTTGGRGTTSDEATSHVSHYSSSGHLGDLAPLNTPRYQHGCSTYTDSSQQQVRVEHVIFLLILTM